MSNERGLRVFGVIQDTYGHEITVRESSAASGPHVWLSIDCNQAVMFPDPHLDLQDAIELRDALNEFIRTAE